MSRLIKRYSESQWIEEVKNRSYVSKKKETIENKRINKVREGVGVKTILRKKSN